MAAGQMIEKPARTGQQQAADNKGFAGADPVDNKPGQQTAGRTA